MHVSVFLLSLSRNGQCKPPDEFEIQRLPSWGWVVTAGDEVTSSVLVLPETTPLKLRKSTFSCFFGVVVVRSFIRSFAVLFWFWSDTCTPLSSSSFLGVGGSQFCFLCLTRLLLFFTCVWDGRNQFCLWMFYSGMEDASLVFYDWVGCFTLGWRRLVWWECLLRDVFWSMFDVNGFYLWKVDVCFVFCVWWSCYSGMHKTCFVLYWKCRFDKNAFGRMRHGLFL